MIMNRTIQHDDPPVPLVAAKKIGTISVFAVCLISLLIINFNHIVDPPYWDSIFVYSQAVWLKNHGFDVLELARQPGYEEGGPNINCTYVIVLGIGVLYKLFDPRSVFLIMHFFNFFCTALLFSLFFTLLIQYISAAPAFIWCLAAASQPILSGQTAAIYLDLPLAAGTAAIIFSLYREKYVITLVACIFMYFVKPSIMILGLALFFFALIKAGMETWAIPKSKRKALSPGFWLLLVPFPAYWALEKIRSSSMPTTLHFDLLATNFRYLWNGCPDLIIISVVVVVLSLMYTIRKYPSIAADGFERNRCYLILLLVVFISGFWVSLILYLNPLYRYTTFMIFPLFCVLALLASVFDTRRTTALALGLIAFNILNQWGALLPAPPTSLRRSGETLERSREYLVDLRANQTICHTIETDFPDRNIVAKYPYIQMLTIPELGYVGKSLPHVFSVALHPTYTSARMVTASLLDDVNTVYFFAQNIFESTFSPSLAPDSEDIILAAETSLKGTLVLYKRKGEWLNRTENSGLVKDWATMFYVYGNLLLSKNAFHEAIQYYEASLGLKLYTGDLYNNLGAAFYQLREYEEAARQFHKSLELDPDSVEARHNLLNCNRILENKNS